jgi:hypothetical protein
MSTSLKAQLSVSGKTFIAKSGCICEEVVGDDTCAGQQIYMRLQFEDDTVDVIEESMDGCGETTSEFIDAFPWHWAKDKHWTIVLGDLERTKYTIIENIRLSMQNDTLIGEKLNEKGTISQEYRFQESTK